MTMVYLGLFSQIFEWVWNKILAPVVNFVADLLSRLFGWIFNTILLPILTKVLKEVLDWFLPLLKEIFSGILYRILSWIFKMIDYMNIAFDIFIGTSKVSYQGKEQSLLNAMMSVNLVSKAFWIITALGIGMAMLLCIYAVMKSSLDFDFENKRPVGAVMRSMLKCFFQFLTIPFFIIFILQLSGIILTAFDTALSDPSAGHKQTLGCIMFGITSLDAAINNSSLNLSSTTSNEDLLTFGKRGEFYSGKISYLDIEEVKTYFDLSKFDYLVGIIMGIFLTVILLICSITFIRRIFELLTLYLVSPLFVSTMPLDDGEKFKKWRELFIAKVFSGYGSVLSMKLYLMLCPIIIGNSIQWGSSATSKDATYFIKLIFLVGGAWAMLKIGPMITSLINAQNGQAEQATADWIGGKADQTVVSAAGWAADKAGSGIGTLGHKFSSGIKQGINKASKMYDNKIKEQSHKYK
ncbi:MAG: hypothetical protein K2K20_07690 [Lachnospiraceae bacterium]|nr:hypothetical protein [Lachnospiraceae bacterium]